MPAVTQLAQGWQIHAGGEGELDHTTGMALVTTLAHRFDRTYPSMVLHAAGSGAGTKDTPGRPNITRVVIGPTHVELTTTPSAQRSSSKPTSTISTPGCGQVCSTRLLIDGASDAWLTPILMKKGRPAHTLNVLCPPNLADGLRQVIYAETTTLGIRQHTVSKHAALRGFAEIDLDGDRVAIKLAHRDGRIVQATPEFEDIARAARRPPHARAASPGPSQVRGCCRWSSRGRPRALPQSSPYRPRSSARRRSRPSTTARGSGRLPNYDRFAKPIKEPWMSTPAPPVIWAPAPERTRTATITGFTAALEQRTGRQFPDYASLHAYSVDDLAGFWSAVADHFQVRWHQPASTVLPEPVMPGADWFPGGTLNYAEHALRTPAGRRRPAPGRHRDRRGRHRNHR